jgi:hypothetical protein
LVVDIGHPFIAEGQAAPGITVPATGATLEEIEKKLDGSELSDKPRLASKLMEDRPQFFFDVSQFTHD